MCMTKKKKLENTPKPLHKHAKAKRPVTVGWSTFIDDIIKQAESQPPVGLIKVASRQRIGSLRATSSPSVTFVEVHSKTEETEQDFKEIDNSCPISFQGGNFSNLCKGGWETGEIKEPKSPLK